MGEVCVYNDNTGFYEWLPVTSTLYVCHNLRCTIAMHPKSCDEGRGEESGGWYCDVAGRLREGVWLRQAIVREWGVVTPGQASNGSTLKFQRDWGSDTPPPRSRPWTIAPKSSSPSPSHFRQPQSSHRLHGLHSHLLRKSSAGPSLAASQPCLSSTPP